jgi:hypothetical protein
MLRGTTIALAAALAFGIGSAAWAGGSQNDAGSSGGYRVGPFGQIFTSGVSPVDYRAFARGAYASAPRHRHPVRHVAR